MERVLLIYPPTGVYLRDDRCQAPVEGLTAQPNREPLDLGYMAATLEKNGCTCRIEDYAAQKATWNEYRTGLAQFKPDMLVLSITTPTLDRDLLAAKAAKEENPDVLTVAKGAHFAERDIETLERYPYLDVAIRGECEFAIVDIANAHKKGDFKEVLGITYRQNGTIVRNSPRPPLDYLDLFPFPARHLIDHKLYTAPDTGEPIAMIYTGRGCPHRCIYCAVTVASGYKLRQRSPANIVAELKECVEVHGIRDFFFRADTFTMHKEWTVEICRQIIDAGLKIRWGSNSRVDTIDEERLFWMKKAGCWVIGFGFESGNQEMLDKMKKNATLEDARQAVKHCKKYGVRVYGLFLLGLPWESRQTAMETIHFAQELNPDFADFNIAYPLPSTEFYQVARDAELFDEDKLHGFDYGKPIIKTNHLSTEELVELRKKALWSFYLRPLYILRTFAKTRSPKVFWNYVRFGWNFVMNQIVFYTLRPYRTREQDKYKEIEQGKKIAEKAEFLWGWDTPAGRLRAQRRARMVIEKGNIEPGKKVLEIGSGTGLFTEYFAKTGAHVHGIDLSPDLIERAKARFKNPPPKATISIPSPSMGEGQGEGESPFSIDLRVADAEKIPYPDNTFDVVAGICVLHHLNLDQVLPEIHRVLKPGGKFIFSEPNMLNPQILLQKNVLPLKRLMGDTDDETAFVRWKLASQLRLQGYDQVQIENFDFLHPWTPKPLIPLIKGVEGVAEHIP
ncbi:MAG: methyltransferase domain-containing protein, partial [Deltaproteobacteria bacterium]|nr:methyltransferase domain-containing protein [Deltaproteobacteria bacterium]